MKKILHIAAKLNIGGAEKVARDIGMYAPADYETHYVVFGDEVGDYEAEVTAKGGKVFHLPSPYESYVDYLRSLKKLINTYHYDVIHAHTMFNIGWAMLAGWLCGVPVRVAHAHSALDEKRSIKVRAYELFMRVLILIFSTDLVAVGQKAGERLFGRRAFRKRGKLILNGIDTAKFAYSESAREKIRSGLGLSDCFVIGHAGHLISVKNQSFLIELMPEILKRRPDARLLLLGEGADRKMLEDKIHTLGLESTVIMTGNVMNVWDYLSAMDVFAFPSLYEGMPLSIIEVQANGLPCVISDGVPRDVLLTDLLDFHSLGEQSEAWINAILSAKRSAPEKYAEELKNAGFDTQTAMDKIYKIYERTQHD